MIKVNTHSSRVNWTKARGVRGERGNLVSGFTLICRQFTIHSVVGKRRKERKKEKKKNRARKDLVEASWCTDWGWPSRRKQVRPAGLSKRTGFPQGSVKSPRSTAWTSTARLVDFTFLSLSPKERAMRKTERIVKKQEELAENKARNGNRTRKDTTTVAIEMGSAKATDPEPYARLTSSLSSIWCFRSANSIHFSQTHIRLLLEKF